MQHIRRMPSRLPHTKPAGNNCWTNKIDNKCFSADPIQKKAPPKSVETNMHKVRLEISFFHSSLHLSVTDSMSSEKHWNQQIYRVKPDNKIKAKSRFVYLIVTKMVLFLTFIAIFYCPSHYGQQLKIIAESGQLKSHLPRYPSKGIAVQLTETSWSLVDS